MSPQSAISYELQLSETADSTGYFACVPQGEIPFPEAVAHLRSCRFDDYMHKHVLGFVQTWNPDQLLAAFDDLAPDDYVIRALVLEASLLNDKFDPVRQRFGADDIAVLADYSPLIYIRHARNRNRQTHRKWITHLGDNIQRLVPLKPPEKIGPCPDTAKQGLSGPSTKAVPLKSFFKEGGYSARRFAPDPEAAMDVCHRAIERLEGIGAIKGVEMRHTASLSPIALLRKWRFSITVRHQALHYDLSGTQTSYGRGLQLETAQAACAMEMIERRSSFADIDKDRLPGLRAASPLLYGSRKDLAGGGVLVLDPKQLGLETDYTGQNLAWLRATNSLDTPVYVPLQSVFLFANYDEPALYTGLGSTGLASGTSREQARLNGMLEVIERDADGTTPYDLRRCFGLASEDPLLAPLLADLKKRGIHVWFQDITPDHGVPAYRCLVREKNQAVYRGTSAHLDGKKAVISALTETPYPYPEGEPTLPPPPDLPVLNSENLPCYSTGKTDLDYHLLIGLLRANGFDPLFADLTRTDLAIPVARALIPGMESLADFDTFSRLHPRLFNNYLKALQTS